MMKRRWLGGARLFSQGEVVLYFVGEAEARLQVELWAENKGLTSHPDVSCSCLLLGKTGWSISCFDGIDQDGRND